MIPAFIVIWAPAVAVGALFGRTKHGAVVGLLLFAIIVALIIAVAI
jgi:hypothetical protein